MKALISLPLLGIAGLWIALACQQSVFTRPDSWPGYEEDAVPDNSLLVGPKPNHLRVLQFNIWQEGTQVPGGFAAIADEIARLNPDLVALSEVRNYNHSPFYVRLLAALQQRGRTYYSFPSFDSGILSRFPLDSTASLVRSDIHGSLFKAVVTLPVYGQLAFYTAHLDYTHGANYMPRGYDPNTWEALPAGPITNVDSILKVNLAADRDESVALFLADAEQEIAQGRMVILGGDFNEPSDKDWTSRTKDAYDHQGLVVPWPTTRTLEAHGFVDAYRAVYPDEVTHPGFTFPSYNKDVPISKLAWGPASDERDRIDFVFVARNVHIQPEKAFIVGPRKSVLRAQSFTEEGEDIFITPQGVWPTDHKAVLVDFRLQ